MNNSFISQLTDDDVDLQEDLDLIFIDIGEAEVVDLQEKNYTEAKEISDKFTDESQQWQTYLNILGLGSVETWFSSQITKIKLNREECPLFKPDPPNLFNAICNLRVGDFKICLVVIKSFSQEVSLPQAVLNSPIFACHFYVPIEILEDEEKALLRGIIRYDQLMILREQGNLKLQGKFYRLALSYFDSQVNHLLVYLHHLNVSAIPLPQLIWQEWLEKTRIEGWATIETINNLFTRKSYAVGWLGGDDDTNVDNSQNLSSLIQLLQNTTDEIVRRQTIGLIGKIGVGNPEAITALIHILHTTENEDTRWETASNLEKIDPNNPEATKTRGKTIDLITQLGNYQVNLIIRLIPLSDGRMGIFIQVIPVNQDYLLPNLKLGILSESGKLVKEIISRADQQDNGMDNSIQLRFAFPSGKNFQVRVSLDSASFTEFVTI